MQDAGFKRDLLWFLSSANFTFAITKSNLRVISNHTASAKEIEKIPSLVWAALQQKQNQCLGKRELRIVQSYANWVPVFLKRELLRKVNCILARSITQHRSGWSPNQKQDTRNSLQRNQITIVKKLPTWGWVGGNQRTTAVA